MKNLNEALNNANTTYQELVTIADKVVKPITGELDNIIENAKNNAQNCTNEDIRQLMYDLSLKAYSLGETKEKSALKLACAEILKDEAYARKFNESDGTVAVKQNIALLESSYETLTQAIYNEAYSMLKTKLDEVHRIVSSLQSILMSRMQEAKLSSINPIE